MAGGPPDRPREKRPAAVLWVDDRPENNALFIDQLMTAGVRVDTARTTAEGLALASRRDYGAVISDMGRWEDGSYRTTAGLDLARRSARRQLHTPALFTSGRATREHGDEARARRRLTSSGDSWPSSASTASSSRSVYALTSSSTWSLTSKLE